MRDPHRRARLGALTRFAVAGVLLVGVLFLAVFPTRAVLDQRDAIATVEERLSVLRAENERMRERIHSLSDPDQVERIAREEYNLARPGEEVYVIVPSPMERLRRTARPAEVVTAISEAWGIS